MNEKIEFIKKLIELTKSQKIQWVPLGSSRSEIKPQPELPLTIAASSSALKITSKKTGYKSNISGGAIFLTLDQGNYFADYCLVLQKNEAQRSTLYATSDGEKDVAVQLIHLYNLVDDYTSNVQSLINEILDL